MTLISRIKAAEMCQVTPQTITNWHAKGLIPGYKISRNLYVDSNSLKKLAPQLHEIHEYEERIATYRQELRDELNKLDNEKKGLQNALGITKDIRGSVTKDLIKKIVENLMPGGINERGRWFVLSLLDGMTYDEIADANEITRERVRQIIGKAQRRFLATNPYEEILRLKKELRKCCIIDKFKVRTYDNDRIANLAIPLSEIPMSRRLQNCCKAAGIQTIGDLAAIHPIHFLKIRNAGRKSMREAEQILQKYDLTLGSDLEDYITKIEDNGNN